MKDAAAGQAEPKFSDLQQTRNQLYIDTVNAILDHLKKPRVESEDVGEAYDRAMAALKEKGFTDQASKKIIQQAEGILMTRYVEASISESSQTQAARATGDDETAANTVQVKIFRVPSRESSSPTEDSPAKEDSLATDASPEAFLKGLFEEHLENIQKGQAPDHDKVLVESSITKQDYAGIRNLRVHQYSGANGVQNIHAHAYILGNDNYEQNLKHLYAQCQPSLKAYHLFFQEATPEAADKAADKAASDAGIFNVSLIDGADGGFFSRPINLLKEDEFKMADKAAEARSTAKTEFKFESANSTVNDYFQSGVSLSDAVIEAAKKAIAAITAKIGEVEIADDENKKTLAEAYNQMNLAMLGVAKLDGQGVTEATAANIQSCLEARKKEISDLQEIYDGLPQLPRDMQIALKPALEAMIMSRCGYGVSLGCKSGKDRTFIVMCMIGALEKNLTSLNNEGFLSGPEFAKAVKDEAMDPSGREIAEGNCDGAFGTKTGNRYMPRTIKRQLGQVDLKELEDHLDASDRCANLNNIKIHWSTRAKRYFLWPFFRQKKSEQLAVQSAQPARAKEISSSPKTTMSVGSAPQKAASLGIFPADMLILKDEILQKPIDGIESHGLLRIIHQYSKQSGIDISQPASDAALKQSLKNINQEAQEDFVKTKIGEIHKASELSKPNGTEDYDCYCNQYGQVASFTATSSLGKDQAQKMVEAYSQLNYQGPIHVNVTSQDELEGAKAASISVNKAVVVRFNGNTYHYPSSEDASQHDPNQGRSSVQGRSSL